MTLFPRTSPAPAARWRKLLLLSLASFFGGSVYTWSLFAVALSEKLCAEGVPAAPGDLAFAFSLAMAGTPFGMVSGGFLNDRFGPRLALPFAALLMFSGLFLASHASTPLGICLAYGIVYGIGSGAGFTSATASAIRLFPERRGLAGGLCAMAFGMSSIAAPVAAGWLLSRLEAAQAITLFGAVIALVITACGLASGGLSKTQKPPFRGASDAPDSGLAAPAMLATPLFWLLFLFMAAEAMAGMALFAQMAEIARDRIGLSTLLASLSVSLLALSNTCGRFIAGAASDRFGRIETLLGMAAASLAGLFALFSAQAAGLSAFLLGLILTGLPFGAFMGTYPSLVADLFGTRHLSANYGFMAFSYTIAGFAGPLLLQWMEGSGGFKSACLALAAITAAGLVIGAAALFAARRFKRAGSRETGSGRRPA